MAFRLLAPDGMKYLVVFQLPGFAAAGWSRLIFAQRADPARFKIHVFYTQVFLMAGREFLTTLQAISGSMPSVASICCVLRDLLPYCCTTSLAKHCPLHYPLKTAVGSTY